MFTECVVAYTSLYVSNSFNCLAFLWKSIVWMTNELIQNINKMNKFNFPMNFSWTLFRDNSTKFALIYNFQSNGNSFAKWKVFPVECIDRYRVLSLLFFHYSITIFQLIWTNFIGWVLNLS